MFRSMLLSCLCLHAILSGLCVAQIPAPVIGTRSGFSAIARGQELALGWEQRMQEQRILDLAAKDLEEETGTQELRGVLSIGKTGFLVTKPKILQVVDDSEALAVIHVRPKTPWIPYRTRTFYIRYVVYLDKCASAFKDRVDDEIIVFRVPLKVAGTKSYTSSLGVKRTVYRLEPVQSKSRDAQHVEIMRCIGGACCTKSKVCAEPAVARVQVNERNRE